MPTAVHEKENVGPRPLFRGLRWLPTERPKILRPQDELVCNHPPFIGKFLDELEFTDPDYHSRRSLFPVVVKKSHRYDLAHLKTLLMLANGDPSGLGRDVIGRSDGPDRTTEIFTKEGNKIIELLRRLPDEEYKAAIATLNGTDADWKSILVFDHILSLTLQNLKDLGSSEEADKFDDRNTHAVLEIYQDPMRTIRLARRNPQMYPEFGKYSDPQIYYRLGLNGEVEQQLLVPPMHARNVEELRRILPEGFDNKNPINPDKPDPLDVIRRANMSGHPLNRAASAIINHYLEIPARTDKIFHLDPHIVQRDAILALKRNSDKMFKRF